VLKFKPFWEEIGSLADAWTKAKEGKERSEEVAITRDFYARQLVPWERANRVLNEYNEWLKEKLG